MIQDAEQESYMAKVRSPLNLQTVLRQYRLKLLTGDGLVGLAEAFEMAQQLSRHPKNQRVRTRLGQQQLTA